MPNHQAPHRPADPSPQTPVAYRRSPSGLLDSIPNRDFVAYSLPTPRPFFLLGVSRVPAGSVIPVHSHPMSALHGCFQGPLTLVTDSGEQALDAGVFYLVGPGVRHSWRNEAPHDAVSVAFWIDATSPGAWPSESGVRDCCRELSRSVRGLHRFNVGGDAELYAHFWGLLDHLSAERPRKMVSTTGLLLSLLGRVAERLAAATPAAAQQLDTAQQIRRLLVARVAEPLNLPKIAAAVGLSTRQVERVFRSAYGSGVMAYFSQLKIVQAKRLLGDASLTVEQVSRRLGFSSPAYFTRTFLRHTGETPTAFRRQRVGAVAGPL